MKKRAVLLLILFAFLSIFSESLRPQPDSPLPGLTLEQVKAIIDTASGERALNHIRHLSLHHRWFVSDGYHDAALYIQRNAREIGLRGVDIIKFKSDGKIFYSTNKSLPKWTVRSAKLSLISPVKKHLTSWEENPITLASNSRSTDVTTELVDAGEGTHAADYEGKDVKGKLVLASAPQGGGRIELVHRLAVLERGAVGVVSYRSYYLDDFPDLVTWDHIWTLEQDGKLSTFGFCISKRMGWELRRLLRQGQKVILHAQVDAELSSGHYEIVSSYIPGTDLREQEIWFIAHLDHCRPSANDNASGSAATLETARTFIELIESGIISRPRRTIRFFWVPEIYGTYAYITNHLQETKRAAAIINMDMVGENHKLCGSIFRITQTPDSSPSILNDLLRFCLDFILSHESRIGSELTNPFAIISPLGTRENWHARIMPYSGGSDHAIFMGGVINVPAFMFGSWPDYFYHSSGDTPDKSDPTQLKRAIVYGTMVASAITNLDTKSGLRLLDQIFPRCLERLDKAIERAQEYLQKSQLSGESLKEALNILHWTAQREVGALRYVANLLPDDKNIESSIEKLSGGALHHSDSGRKYIQKFYKELCIQRGKKISSSVMTKEEKQAKQLIPMRNNNYPGPLSIDYITLELKEKGWSYHNPFTGFQRYELGAFIDGNRSALDIHNAVSAECGPVKLSDVLDYLKKLEAIGLVSFKK